MKTWSRVGVMLLLFGIACAPKPTAKKKAPQIEMVEARVFVYKTHLEPDQRDITTEMVKYGDRVRLAEELDQWRLFDLKKKEVIRVDAVARNYTRIPLADLLEGKKSLSRTPAPDHAPDIRLQSTGRSETLSGYRGSLYQVDAGGFHRELWLSDDAVAGEGLWPLWMGSEPATGEYAPRTALMHLQLAAHDGIPLLDRSAISYGEKQLLAERTLLRVEQRKVPRALMEIPPDYTDLTPVPTAPGAGRPGASSRPSDQSVPAAGSRSF